MHPLLRALGSVGFWLLVVAIILYTVFPFYWAIVTSLKTGSGLFSAEIVPSAPTLANYLSVFTGAAFERNILNSIIVAVSVVALSLVLALSAAFALSRIAFRGRGLLLLTILAVSMFPQVAVLSGLFELIRALGLYNTQGGLILSYMIFTLPFTVWVLTTFMRELPIELEEAAVVDGASPLVILVRVFLPLMGPAMAATGLLAFIAAWNEFLFALTFTLSNDERHRAVDPARPGLSTAHRLRSHGRRGQRLERCALAEPMRMPRCLAASPRGARLRRAPEAAHSFRSKPRARTMMNCVALIVAAGSGERFGSERPKQYQDLLGRPILRRSAEAFLGHPAVDGVQVVINPAHRPLYDEATAGLGLPEPLPGGSSRQESVRLGLERLALTTPPPELVLIHDAARPLVDAATIDRVLAALATGPAAIAAVPVTDTLKREAGGFAAGTVDRAHLWRAQTPQGFRFDDILAAHRASAGATLTDDAAVAEQAGLKVALVPGHPENLKVTTSDDLERARRLLGAAPVPDDVRIGFGFDVHRLRPGDGVVLCGVPIPFDRALEGHSDADVGLHALTDAILGAFADGDIGSHFPPSDARWRGADSATFVRHAVARLHARGGLLAHADVTLICEHPKIGPHRPAMVARLAELLGVSPDRVSVKATTTERLGFTGRGEGIAAHAVATIRLPGRSETTPQAVRR
jgi:2-C-methyl-D-erythritol 4-phosphate cytidylyltransferase/2-C-methyl-D-erythritol 2,4-cyclodiphosphate synthase